MRVYIGECRGKKFKEATALGFGICVSPQTFRAPKSPPNFYFVDNGAFYKWKRQERFSGWEFRSFLRKVLESYPFLPDFVVIPDVVADSEATVKSFLKWYPELKQLISIDRLAFVVQDGMEREEVVELLSKHPVGYLFVGGSLEWKLLTGRVWVEVARELSIKCHIGRVGTPRRVTWAKVIGADSIDSSLPLFSRAKWRRFVRAVTQEVLFSGGEYVR